MRGSGTAKTRKNDVVQQAARHDHETDALSGAYGAVGGPRGGPVEFESVRIRGAFRFGNLDGLCAKHDHWAPTGRAVLSDENATTIRRVRAGRLHG